jgi:hypothetical protein
MPQQLGGKGDIRQPPPFDRGDGYVRRAANRLHSEFMGWDEARWLSVRLSLGLGGVRLAARNRRKPASYALLLAKAATRTGAVSSDLRKNALSLPPTKRSRRVMRRGREVVAAMGSGSHCGIREVRSPAPCARTRRRTCSDHRRIAQRIAPTVRLRDRFGSETSALDRVDLPQRYVLCRLNDNRNSERWHAEGPASNVRAVSLAHVVPGAKRLIGAAPGAVARLGRGCT